MAPDLHRREEWGGGEEGGNVVGEVRWRGDECDSGRKAGGKMMNGNNHG